MKKEKPPAGNSKSPRRSYGVQLGIWDDPEIRLESDSKDDLKRTEVKDHTDDDATMAWIQEKGEWIYAPTLFKFADLNIGYLKLGELQFEEALASFQRALEVASQGKADILEAIEICEFWMSRTREKKYRTEEILEYLNAYSTFPFQQQMRLFKRNLLRYFGTQIPVSHDLEFRVLYAIVDLLLAQKDYDPAIELIVKYLRQWPVEKDRLHYLLAQAIYLSGRRQNLARACYAIALLKCPKEEFRSRIVVKDLDHLVERHGIAFAPVYGALNFALPFYRLPEDIAGTNEEHSRALKAYRMVYDVNVSRRKRENASLKRYGKELEEKFPEIYQSYVQLVKSGRRLEIRHFPELIL